MRVIGKYQLNFLQPELGQTVAKSSLLRSLLKKQRVFPPATFCDQGHIPVFQDPTIGMDGIHEPTPGRYRPDVELGPKD